jgi:hypothetical protein
MQERYFGYCLIVCPYLTGLYMHIKVLQLLQTKHIVCPAILRHQDLPLTWYFSLFTPGRDVGMFLVDNKRWSTKPSNTDVLDDCYPFAITWLDKLRLSMFLSTCNNLHGPNDTHLEASLIKVVDVIVMDTILGFGVLYQLKPRTNYLWILLEYPLPILSSIEGHLEFS